MSFDYLPKGPFELTNQNRYFGGWPTLNNNPKVIVMAFPVEGWNGSAAVTLQQSTDGRIIGNTYGPSAVFEKAQQQALACLSLDIAAENWPLVGQRDGILGELQDKYSLLRPNLFHSPYEAAAGFIIGHRTTIKQKQRVMMQMSNEFGEKIAIDGQIFHAFPNPQTLLSLTKYKGSLTLPKLEVLTVLHQSSRSSARRYFGS